MNYSRFSNEILPQILRDKSGTTLEIDNLYRAPIEDLPIDSLESLILLDDLKTRGFKVINWARGNFIGGPRMVNYSVQKEDCFCDLIKWYYKTEDPNDLKRTESISCMDSLTYYSTH